MFIYLIVVNVILFDCVGMDLVSFGSLLHHFDTAAFNLKTTSNSSVNFIQVA